MVNCLYEDQLSRILYIIYTFQFVISLPLGREFYFLSLFISLPLYKFFIRKSTFIPCSFALIGANWLNSWIVLLPQSLPRVNYPGCITQGELPRVHYPRVNYPGCITLGELPMVLPRMYSLRMYSPDVFPQGVRASPARQIDFACFGWHLLSWELLPGRATLKTNFGSHSEPCNVFYWRLRKPAAG